MCSAKNRSRKTAADARKVLKAAAASKNISDAGDVHEILAGLDRLKKIVGEKTYGRVLAANFRRLSAMPAWGGRNAPAGGALLDFHIHDTDFVNFLFGRPQSVFSTGVTGAGRRG